MKFKVDCGCVGHVCGFIVDWLKELDNVPLLSVMRRVDHVLQIIGCVCSIEISGDCVLNSLDRCP